MCTQQAFPPHGVCELAQIPVNSASWSSEDEHVPGSVELSARQGPESCSRWPDVKHSNGPGTSFFYMFVSLDYLFGWWQLKHFFMFTPKIGEDEPNFDFRICFLDGLVKNPQRVVYVASVILETHQVGVNRRLRLKFRWISRRPGFRDDGNVRYFRVHDGVFGTQPPHLGRWCLDGEFLDEFLLVDYAYGGCIC